MSPFDKDDARRVWDEINACKIQLATMGKAFENFEEEISRTRRRLHDLENSRTGITLSKEVMEDMNKEIGGLGNKVAALEAEKKMFMWFVGLVVPFGTATLIFVGNLLIKLFVK